jgi:2-alkyl-3-oxoalkanoate reductase
MGAFLVTGASGFVGGALAEKLLSLGHTVVGVSRRRVKELEELGLKHVAYDLTQDVELLLAGVSKAFPCGLKSGFDAIFHTAAKVDVWGDYQDFYKTNFLGTAKLLELAKRCGVGRFIFTSTPSVVSGSGDLKGVNETFPYPLKYQAFYPETKALAEKLVIGSNSATLKTVSLRPHLIFGPKDNHLIPTILDKARRKKLKIIGTGDNLTDVCFIDDCILAHLTAFQALGVNPRASGRAFFISQGEPIGLWDWINEILAIFLLPPVTKTVSPLLARALAHTAELYSTALFRGQKEPLLTRFLVDQMSTSHYFDISAAKKELGFKPQYSVKKALSITKDYYLKNQI